MDTDRPRVNIELLETVMQHTDRLVALSSINNAECPPSEYKHLTHVGTWDQSCWRRIGECGTTMCFAGWTAQIAGGVWVIANESDYRNRPDGAAASMLVAEPEDDPRYLWSFGGDTPMISAKNRAKRLLGLTSTEADDLFAGGNTLGRLHKVVADLIREQRIRDAREDAGK